MCFTKSKHISHVKRIYSCMCIQQQSDLLQHTLLHQRKHTFVGASVALQRVTSFARRHIASGRVLLSMRDFAVYIRRKKQEQGITLCAMKCVTKSRGSTSFMGIIICITKRCLRIMLECVGAQLRDSDLCTSTRRLCNPVCTPTPCIRTSTYPHTKFCSLHVNDQI